MTHRVGVSELHQRWDMFRLSGFQGSLSVTTLASLRVRAAARVLPRGARAASTARWDVLLVGVCSDGCCSALRWKRNGQGNHTSTFHLSLSHNTLVCFYQLDIEQNAAGKLNTKVILMPHLLIPSQAVNVLFSFNGNSIYCPHSY